MNEHFYSVDLLWKKERKGSLSSPELQQEIEVATPPQFPGGMEGIWSPEHLFTAAVNSCLMTTFLAIAENSKLNYQSFECSAKGKLEKVENKFLMTEVILYPKVKIQDENDRDKASRVLEKSERNCLISNSIKSKVTLMPEISVMN